MQSRRGRFHRQRLVTNVISHRRKLGGGGHAAIYTARPRCYHSQTFKEIQMKRMALIAALLCITPMVRADDDQKKTIEDLSIRVTALEKRVADLEKMLAPMQGDA